VSAPSITSPPEGSYDNDGAFVLSGSAPDFSIVEVYEVSSDGQYSRVGSTATYAGRWQLPLSAVPEGSHAYKAKANKAGRYSSWSNTRTVTVDTRAPAPPAITSPASGANVSVNGFMASGTAEPNSTVELFEGSTSKGIAQADSSGNWSVTVGSIASGTHSYQAKAKDLAGNVSGASDTLQVTAITHQTLCHRCIGTTPTPTD
jgi:hypothetical protein